MNTFPVGQRVRIKLPVEKYPLGVFRYGEVGTVTYNDGVLIKVRLDHHYNELNEWNNQLHFDAYAAAECEYIVAGNHLEVIA